MSTQDPCMINIVHEEDGLFANGTISTLDGFPKASWTFDQDGIEFTQIVDVDGDDFDELWNAISKLDVFRRNQVKSQSTEMDFRNYYIVGIAFVSDTRSAQSAFLIPSGEADPEWLHWLARAEATQKAQ